MNWLVEDWKQMHKWLSVQFASLLAAITVAYDQLAVLQQALGAQAFHTIQAALAIGVVIARVAKQGKKPE
jgi:hypothetical protein